MNKKGLVIIAVLVVIVIGIVLIFNNKGKTESTLNSDEKIDLISSDEENIVVKDNISEKVSSRGVPSRFVELVTNFVDKGLVDLEDIKSNDVLHKELELDNIGEYEGVLISNSSEDNYNEVFLIAPSDKSFNDTMLIKMINHYESIKNAHPDSTYLREAENVSIKQQGGVSIFILSKNNEKIYETINSSNY